MSNNSKPYVIAITLQKGGLGKTSIAVNLAATLSTRKPSKYSRRKNKVLLIDFDVHATASHYLEVYNEKELGLYDVLVGNCTFDEAIKNVEYNFGVKGGICSIDIIPSFTHLHNIEENWKNYEDPKNLFLNSIKLSNKFKSYDYVIVDCPPESDCLLSNVYNVCNYYILPVFADTQSHINLGITYEQIGTLSSNNIERNVLGCVINNYIKSELSTAFCQALSNSEHIDCFNTIIPHCRRYDQTLFFKEPIPFFHRNTHKIQPIYNAFNSFTDEVINKINSIES